ncbi:MAG: LytTR family transcriptional regulator DNA-binding domain-containing protein [Agathobacter sp.]
MQEAEYITIISNRRKVKIQKDQILYVRSRSKRQEVHVYERTVYKTLTPLWELAKELGERFVEVQRGCIVAERAIDRISDRIYLVNGEALTYTVRNKKEIVEKLRINPKNRIKIPVRGVYQIMNPDAFERVDMEDADSTIEKESAIEKESTIEKESAIENETFIGKESTNADEKKDGYFTYLHKKRENSIAINTILYVTTKKNIAQIHTQGNHIYPVRMTLKQIREQLGDDFFLVGRSTLVSARAVHNISDKIYLSNGETLNYSMERKKEVKLEFRKKQKEIIGSFAGEDVPKTYEEYCRHYSGFEQMPFAYTDIEMVFDEDLHAVDWIFRYGNPALARLEKLPLKKLIGSTFGSLFPNMDSKWVRSYEQAALYGEKLEMIDYSPEIDTYLKVICFPTFPGHCGCILFNIEDIKFTKNSGDAEKALMLYMGKLPEKDS